jgi:beta-galactosidase
VLAIAMAWQISAAPVPLTGNAPVTLDKLRSDNAAVLSMNGTWRFKLEHGMSPAENGVLPESTNTADGRFAAAGMSDADWKNIPVPANWEIEGFSRPTFQDRGTNASDDIGLYRRLVEVPANFAGKQVLWHFDGVYDGTEVFVNGQRVGYHESGFTAFDVDVTRALQPGKRNLFALRVYKKTPSGTMDKGDFWCLGGIYRDNYLVALPPLHVDDVTIVTDLDTNYQNAILNTTIRLVGQAGAWFNVAGELYGLDGGRISTPSIRRQGIIGADGTTTLTFRTPVKSPKLWSAEKPNLYYIVLQLDSDGRTTERVQERFGFRKIENRNGVLLWNGVPIKCTGICRHEEFSPYGHALTEQCWETDVALMKAANINAIRTSHYNHSARFLELCDEAGFYVLDEVPFCWVAADPQFNLRNTNAVWAFLLRSKETLARDKNRPCIMAWSIGNESGYGPNAQSAFAYMKANDATRPAFISQQGLRSSPLMDFDDAHYPTLANLQTMATNQARCKVPLILTEEPHTFCTASVINYDYGVEDFWGQALVNIWDVVWPTDAIVGSFVWEWQDQGMTDKFPDRTGVDPITGMRDENNKGIVTSDRKLKPAYWHLKMVYSPVTTAMREVALANGQCFVSLQNRYSFTDLSELTCRWQALAGEKELAHGESHIECQPRSSTNAAFPAIPGMNTLRLEFIHPDERSVYVVRLHTTSYQSPAPPPALVANNSVKLSETDDIVLIQVAGTKLTVDKHTGQISSWRADGRDMVIGGPILNLGEGLGGGRKVGRRDQGTSGKRSDPPVISSSQPPQLKNAVVNAKMEGAVAKISVTEDVFMAGTNELKGKLTYTLDVGTNAQANVAWNLVWDAPSASAGETGLKFLLPATTDTMSWFCDSRWTEYPADHIGKPEGTVTSKDISFRSSKRDLHWMSLSGAGKYALVALSWDNKPLAARGRSDANGTTLFLTSAIGGPTGELSLNSVPGDEILLTPGNSIGGMFQLRIATKKVKSTNTFSPSENASK